MTSSGLKCEVCVKGESGWIKSKICKSL